MTRAPEATRPPPRGPELDAEDEIDLARYWRALAARWWLPLIGLAAGIVIGYALSIGGKDVWRARALVYLGQPLSPGYSQVQSPATNPSTVREIIRSDAVLARVAQQTGLERRKLAAGATSAPVKGNVPRLGQTPLVAVSVKGEPPGKIAAATNLLAQTVVDEMADYPNAKIEDLEEEIAENETELRKIDVRTTEIERSLGSLSASERVSALGLLGFAEQRRGVVRQDLHEARQALALAENVERPQVLERGVARKTTARSTRNSLVVGGALGLLLGAAAALLWAPLVGLRTPA